jgi:hypothetical protein
MREPLSASMLPRRFQRSVEMNFSFASPLTDQQNLYAKDSRPSSELQLH